MISKLGGSYNGRCPKPIVLNCQHCRIVWFWMNLGSPSFRPPLHGSCIQLFNRKNMDTFEILSPRCWGTQSSNSKYGAGWWCGNGEMWNSSLDENCWKSAEIRVISSQTWAAVFWMFCFFVFKKYVYIYNYTYIYIWTHKFNSSIADLAISDPLH